MFDILFEWFVAGLRWLHVMAGIAWVGTSFYFNWFDSLVRPTKDNTTRPNNRGTIEEIHGGSFYYHEQYWPDKMPADLKRHSWPAKTNLLTGIFLMATIYWVGASTYLIDRSVMDLAVWMAIVISIGSITISWYYYQVLCWSTPSNLIVLVSMAGWMALWSWIYLNVFGSRAAFIHVGALMGSIMGLNVWFVIVPNHIAMTKQLAQGEKLNTHHGYLAKRVSQHNNYFALPVVFTMISNHFSFIYNARFGYLVLILVLFAGWAIRYAFNIHYTENKVAKTWVALILVCFLVAIGLSMVPKEGLAKVDARISSTEVMGIIQEKCSVCHSAAPTYPGFSAPPLGLALDTLDHFLTSRDKVYDRTLVIRDMPLGNLTQMSDEQRDILSAWYEQNTD